MPRNGKIIKARSRKGSKRRYKRARQANALKARETNLNKSSSNHESLDATCSLQSAAAVLSTQAQEGFINEASGGHDTDNSPRLPQTNKNSGLQTPKQITSENLFTRLSRDNIQQKRRLKMKSRSRKTSKRLFKRAFLENLAKGREVLARRKQGLEISTVTVNNNDSLNRELNPQETEQVLPSISQSQDDSRLPVKIVSEKTAYQAKLELARKVRYAQKLANLVNPKPVPPEEENVPKKPTIIEAIELSENEITEYRQKRLNANASITSTDSVPRQPSCIILRPKRRKETPSAEPKPVLEKRKRIKNYAALLNVDITKKSKYEGIKHAQKPGPRGNNRAHRSIQLARRIQSAKNSEWRSRRKYSKPIFCNENESYCDLEEEIEIGENDFVSEPVILESSPHENIHISEEQESRCLICFHHDPNPPPLKGLLPKSKRLTNPEQLEDDMRIIYLLKMIFQWTTTELRYPMKISNGQSPREWFHLCQSCRLLIFEIQTLEDRMRDCRKKIKDKIMKTTEMSSLVQVSGGTMMTRRSRSLVNQQVRSAKANTAFIDGDRKAEELVALGVNWNRSELNEGSINNENEQDADQTYDHINLEISKSKPFDEFYICPYCPQENATSSTDAKMDFVEFFYHLIFHYDHPLKCTECKVFLPEDPSNLDAHWHQYHSELNVIPSMRYIETQINSDSHIDSEIKEENPLNHSMNHSTVLCGDCLKDDIEMKFESMKTFKIHQALKHPAIARCSCPLCPLVFIRDENNRNTEENRTALKDHLKSVHKIYKRDYWRSYLCKFCGRGVQNDTKEKLTTYITNFALAETLHMLSRHVQLIQAIYTCTSCSKDFSSFQTFVEHANSNADHPKITWNPETRYLCHVDFNKITCGLCVGQEEPANFKSNNLHSFLYHINSIHSVAFEWKTESLKTKGMFAKSEIRIEEMTEVCSVFKRDAQEVRKAVSLVNGNIKPAGSGTPMYKYTCPSCPHLRKMNLDAFLLHLIFHWRRPNKCLQCKAYLPFALEAINEHWKHHHPDLDSSTEIKFEQVVINPGDVFRCEKCPEKFPSIRDRNEHEQASHGWRLERTNRCGVCNEPCTNTDELRLHRAIDHPEVASVGCYYCEEIFPAESIEGVNFLDCEALQQHSVGKEDHPKCRSKAIDHLYACDFCGMVIKDTKMAPRLRLHISQKHAKGRSGSAPMWCFICNVELRQASLWTHLFTTHTKNCICDTCGEEMRPWTLPIHNLTKHEILMEGYEQFRCKEDECDYATVYQRSLKRHVSVNHSKERKRKHKCSICEKAFFTSVHLREHVDRHKNKETRPFQCEICGGAYAARTDLYIHKRLSHLNRKFPSTNRKRTKRLPDPDLVQPGNDSTATDQQTLSTLS